MAYLSADRKTEYMEGIELSLPVDDGDTIYAGAMVSVNAQGFAVRGGDTAGTLFAGIAREHADNGSGGDGDINVLVRRRGLYRMSLATAISQANVGANVFMVDDQTVDLVGNVTHAIFCGVIAGYIDTTHAWIDIEPAIKQADVAVHIADTSAAHGAGAIAITDAGDFTAEITVEAALQEIYPKIPVAIADPGDAGAIPVTRSGSVAVTTAKAETRSIAAPAIAGITLAVTLDVDGGDCVITVASAINQAGNNKITLDNPGETVVLTAVQVGGAKVWRVAANDGATLGTV